MSTRSDPQPATSEPAAVNGSGAPIPAAPDSIIDLCRKTRQRAIADLYACDDPARIASIVDGVIRVHEAAARMEPDFFSTGDLERRWKMARKTVERTGIPRHKMGGVVRFARADVVAFEKKTREENA